MAVHRQEDASRARLLSNDSIKSSPRSTTCSSKQSALHEGTLTMWDGIALVCGDIIGSGIFASPGIALRLVVAPCLSLGLWFSGGALTLAGTLCLMELTAARPDAGGLFAHLRNGCGDAVAFSWQWMQFVVMGPGCVSALALTFAQYVIGIFTDESVDMLAPSFRVKAVAAAVLLIAGAGNCLRASGMADAARFFVANAAISCVFVVGLACYALTYSQEVGPEPSSLENIAQEPPSWDSSGTALISILWAFSGWTDMAAMSEELVEPSYTLPRVALGSLTIITGMYMLMNVAYLSVLPEHVVASSGALGVDFARHAAGAEWAAKAMAILVSISCFGAVCNCLFFMGRQFYATARDGQFPKFLEYTTPAGAPWAAVMTTAIVGAVIVFVLPNFESIITYLSFSLWIFYAAVGLLVIIMRRREPDLYRPYKVPFYPFLPIAFSGISLATSFSLMLRGDALSLGVPLVFMVSSFPIHHFFFSRHSDPALHEESCSFICVEN